MTSEEIDQRLIAIARDSHDAERAHALEIQLRADFIRYLASLDYLPNLSAKAKKILSSDDTKFPRWVA